MEIIILVAIGWLVYAVLKKNSSRESNTQRKKASDTYYGSGGSCESSINSNTTYSMESNAVLVQQAIDSSHSLRFQYVDQDGEITERTVTPEYIERRHDAQVLCLVAHCHMRGASRTFVIRRMQNIRIN